MPLPQMHPPSPSRVANRHRKDPLQHIFPPQPDIPQISHDRPPRRHVHENYDRRPFEHATTRNVLNEKS